VTEREWAVIEEFGGEIDITFSEHIQDAIVANIRAALKKKKISQRDFATDIGMPEGMLSKILTGARKLHGQELAKMAKVLGVHVDDLLTAGTG
jgi:transcriptional regulator with XRE-family HTH domain